MGGPNAPPPHISVAVGVVVGLLASFVQSLGLTIQRKSHLQNEALPSSLRVRDHRRPLWLGGFAIFICSNLLGTIFQIGALPIVVLGPLGAVSLLYNAFFARIILGDEFSVNLVAGTVLIAGGAVLIGIFGVVPEVTHTLDELVRLYSRPAFIVYFSLLSLSLTILVTFAHFAEWAFERRLRKLDTYDGTTPPTTPLTPRSGNLIWRKASRRLSGSRPSHHHDSHSAPPLQPSSPQGRYGAVEAATPRQGNEAATLVSRNKAGGSAPEQAFFTDAFGSDPAVKAWTSADDPAESIAVKEPMSCPAMERTRVMLGVAYGAASGTLSGLCLLFAKTGIELLILTVVGQNQFGRFEAWLIVLVLLVAAVLQLFYLNRALRLVGPTLICPLAFCFYNLSSIISGLIYYNQWEMLSALQFGLVSLGTAILLAGVWIVSIKANGSDKKMSTSTSVDEMDRLLCDEPESFESDTEGSDEEPVEWLPRGLTIGLGAMSPGFDIRPAGHRRTFSQPHTSTTLPYSSTFPSHSDDAERPLLHERHFSEAEGEVAAGQLARRRRERRGFSFSGALYVGRRTASEVESAPSSPLLPTAEEEGVPAAPVSRKMGRRFGGSLGG